MTTILFLSAAILALLWLVVHVFAGGKEVAGPLRAAVDLDPVVRDVLYQCWHFTSVAIASTAVFFSLAVFLAQPAYAVAGTIMAVGLSLVGIGLVAAIGQSHLKTPQGWLFVPVAGCGIFGLLI